MGRNITDESETSILSQQLLLSIAEELKMPLIQIARLSENSRLVDINQHKTSAVIQETATSALRLIDNYILGVRLSIEPQNFDIEAVSVSSVLYDAGQQLDALAKNYGVKLELNVAGKFGPVSANRQGLQAALVSLGAALIEALPALDNCQLKLHLATHRSRYGIVAGVYADTKQISAQAMRAGRKLQISSRQPFLNLTHNNGAGIFIADAILNAMDLSLMASRHHSLYGIGTLLNPNHQLQLVA